MKNSKTIVVLIAVGPLATSKSRLFEKSNYQLRETFVLSMLIDMLNAIRLNFNGIIAIVSPDEKIHKTIKQYEVISIIDEGKGTNAAIKTALAHENLSTADSVVIFQGDLPQLTSKHVNFVIDDIRDLEFPGVLIIRNDDGGTSVLALSPPNIIEPAFGSDSGKKHKASAIQENVLYRELDIEILKRDVDTLEDLELLSSHLGNETNKIFEQMEEFHNDKK